MQKYLTPARRKAVYRLMAVVFLFLVAYGIVDAQTADSILEAVPELLAAVVSLLANANVTPDDDPAPLHRK